MYFLCLVVLNEKQRIAKRKLIECNRERRKEEQEVIKIKYEKCDHNTPPSGEAMTDEDRQLIEDIMAAYEHTSVKVTKTYTIVSTESRTVQCTLGVQVRLPNLLLKLQISCDQLLCSSGFDGFMLYTFHSCSLRTKA